MGAVQGREPGGDEPRGGGPREVLEPSAGEGIRDGDHDEPREVPSGVVAPAGAPRVGVPRGALLSRQSQPEPVQLARLRRVGRGQALLRRPQRLHRRGRRLLPALASRGPHGDRPRSRPCHARGPRHLRRRDPPSPASRRQDSACRW